jgi:hypothetical protein
MGDCYVNIRIGLWHFQVTHDWTVRVSKNEFHRGYPQGRFAVYDLFGLPLGEL